MSVATSGCATMFSGSSQKIKVSSQPAGAEVRAEPGDVRATTPGVLSLRRKDAPYRLTFELEGHEPYSVTLVAEQNGWVWANLILGGIVGLIIDSNTGAAIKMTPGEVHANLVRIGAADPSSSRVPASDGTLYVFSETGDLLATLSLD